MNDTASCLRPRRSARALVCTAALLAVFTSGGHAADKPREGSFGSPRANSPLLTRAQLRDCLGQQDRVRSASQALAAEQARLGASKTELERLGATLKEELVTLDRTNAEAVAAYNAQVEKRDKMIDDYQDGVPAYNAKVEALKTDQAAFATACGNRRYDESEEALIRQGK
jgi:hypothetical protein